MKLHQINELNHFELKAILSAMMETGLLNKLDRDGTIKAVLAPGILEATGADAAVIARFQSLSPEYKYAIAQELLF